VQAATRRHHERLDSCEPHERIQDLRGADWYESEEGAIRQTTGGWTRITS
jgi:hypothetical protein